MAEAVVSFAVERMGDLLISEAKRLYSVRDQITEIQRDLKQLRCFLEEADKRQNRDKRVQEWVAEMRELAFKIEDVTEISALKFDNKTGFKYKLRRFACMLREGVSRHKISTEIDAIGRELDRLTARLPTYGITRGIDGETSRPQVDLRRQRTSYSHDVEKDFVGMEKDIERLICLLSEEDKGCEVVSICGMGGLGKTTLAKKVYNHVRVRSHFKAFAWVCVTQEFQFEIVLRDVLKELVPADRKGEVSTMSNAELVRELYQVQQKEKCLIVIDDIWKMDAWRSLIPAFPLGDVSSATKILLTTRNMTVAQVGRVNEISGLTEEEGWLLFSKKVRMIDFPEKMAAFGLEPIGRDMVKKCQGLPLAISSLGGILKGKYLLREWENVNKSISFYLARGEGITDADECFSVSQILGLSYDDLPPRLRHCFLCFANYGEDEVISTEDLYMLWIAEGLISLEDKSDGEMMLDVAERYLDELAQRSLVQVETGVKKIGEPTWSKYSTCHVHDLIRDLCLSKVKEENFLKVIYLRGNQEGESSTNVIRRLCAYWNDYDDNLMSIPYDEDVMSHIRSLLVRKLPKFALRLAHLQRILSFQKLKLLRVLILTGCGLNVQDIKEISELVYLKCLSLHGCVVGFSFSEGLPSSIGNLRYLETLDLRVDDFFVRMPDVIWKLKNLVHLYLPKFMKVLDKSDNEQLLRLDGLDKLEVIHNFDSQYMDAHGLFQLHRLKMFVGKFGMDDTSEESIVNFTKSRELRYSVVEIKTGEVCCFELFLECCFIDTLKISTCCALPKVYDHSRFSRHLTCMELSSCGFDEDPMTLLEKLPNLGILFLHRHAYMGSEMKCTATGFPRLQHLSILELPNLKVWRVDEGAMPFLISLKISACGELVTLPQGLEYLTSLQSLDIYGMPREFRHKIKVRDDEREDYYKVRHIRHVRT